MDPNTTERVEQGLRELVAAAVVAKAPELESLMTLLGQRLVAGNRLSEAAELLASAVGHGLRLGAVLRQLAQAHVRGGYIAGAEPIIRELL